MNIAYEEMITEEIQTARSLSHLSTLETRVRERKYIPQNRKNEFYLMIKKRKYEIQLR